MSELIPLLNVEDVSRSIVFYETALGTKVENQWEMEGRIRWARVSFDGGKLIGMVDLSVHVPIEDMGMCEALHGVIFHADMSRLRTKLTEHAGG